jgi:hypothetical protein
LAATSRAWQVVNAMATFNSRALSLMPSCLAAEIELTRIKLFFDFEYTKLRNALFAGFYLSLSGPLFPFLQ